MLYFAIVIIIVLFVVLEPVVALTVIGILIALCLIASLISRIKLNKHIKEIDALIKRDAERKKENNTPPETDNYPGAIGDPQDLYIQIDETTESLPPPGQNISIHPQEPDNIKIAVKGVDDRERALIELGHKIQRLLIDGICHRLAVILEDAPATEYATTILSTSRYPFHWIRKIEAEQRGETLIIDYHLPAIDDIPDILEITYRREQPLVVAPNDSRIKELWTDISYQITLRSIYELFSSSSSQLSAIDAIAFNGIVESVDTATGHSSEKCVLSVMATRQAFTALDFSRIDPARCFKSLRGIAAHDLSSLTPVPPVMPLDKRDKRFIDPGEILSTIDPEINLAAMDWKDFENLIRELFEKEFSAEGAEVKITRASKDGGVDAVVFDPDPIRGGKIIIQAKRYTNTVGVSAVRDLYGTVHNEGAIKGILVTTSDYGSDSYNFAKDKPLTLINGANLLHLLSKHGYKAGIDIARAKKLLKDTRHE